MPLDGGDTVKVEEIPVKDIMIIPGMHWLEKRMPKFRESIKSVGMEWPIIITDDVHYWQKEKNWPNIAKSLPLLKQRSLKRAVWPQKRNRRLEKQKTYLKIDHILFTISLFYHFLTKHVAHKPLVLANS